jgi:YHS domain-containing protein
MKTMSNRKLIRRTFLAAAMTMSGAHATSASGFQQEQYQPGQPGQQIPQGNSSVTQELNRMFQESGQQMPSMNAQELPNANVPTQGQVRPRQTQSQPQVNTGSASRAQPPQTGNAPKRSVMGRFFGKFRGETGKSNPNYRPPVPPDENPMARSTATAGNLHQPPQGKNPSPQNGQLTQSVPNGQTQSETLQNSPRTEAVRATNKDRAPSSAPNVLEDRPQYTQPGSAPGFMSTAGAAKVIQKQPAAAPSSRDKFQDDFISENTGGPTGVKQKVRTTTAEAAMVKKAEDGFESPFIDAAESSAASEPLDLDSLIDIPAGEPQPVESVTKKLQPLEQSTPGTSRTVGKPAEVVSESAESDRAKGRVEETVPEAADAESIEAPEENPFTGVQLESSDEKFFGSQGPATGAEAGSFGTAAAPMEDFHSNLPSVDLPPVDEENAAAGVELKETPPLESVEPTEVARQKESFAPADTAARAELQTRSQVPKGMSASETARLRQVAEQERRQNQQRQIQARAGQTGFKGFCPVALRERRDLVEASEQFTSTFGLQTYAFSSAESKAAFDADPSRYAPAAGGSDVVVLVNSGEEEAGQLDYALWYRDRLYLFRSRETMTLFSKDPQRFASQY